MHNQLSSFSTMGYFTTDCKVTAIGAATLEVALQRPRSRAPPKITKTISLVLPLLFWSQQRKVSLNRSMMTKLCTDLTATNQQ